MVDTACTKVQPWRIKEAGFSSKASFLSDYVYI